ncbi:hypothetical protein [Candidatus Mycolicibacterium alkanivorans]|uniref:DUF222 domain-containing protein n=1 Tax=Candidatus Mycolicibacterium alkanivorans TaxID=2954114 RepID=A0ABS9YUA4_9MYCO|nr:hypothetical protein [Candidatus Mycolicibacterium alkanivorans]MCI4674803.1 hypothetical protein [Candidatus Mycolicibacterium alkanivorans]
MAEEVGPHELGGPHGLCRNRFGTEQHIEQHFGDEAVRARQAVEQCQWIRLRPALATADRGEGCGDGHQAAQSAWLADRQRDAHMPAPRIAHSIHRLGDTEVIEHLAGGLRAFIECEVAVYRTAAAVSGTVDCHNVPVRGERVDHVHG